jgi:uncharacterized protein (DUF488 family)
MTTSPLLHTIGYEGSSIDEFLRTLDDHGITLLIDVRDVPISRKKGFSKNKLAEALRGSGVDYLHLKGLGDPKAGRIAAREGRFADFRRIFGAHMTTSLAQRDLDRGVAAARSSFACLLCFERDHRNCHRCIVAEEMASRGGFRLVHLQGQRGDRTPSSSTRRSGTHVATAPVG